MNLNNINYLIQKGIYSQLAQKGLKKEEISQFLQSNMESINKIGAAIVQQKEIDLSSLGSLGDLDIGKITNEIRSCLKEIEATRNELRNASKHSRQNIGPHVKGGMGHHRPKGSRGLFNSGLSMLSGLGIADNVDMNGNTVQQPPKAKIDDNGDIPVNNNVADENSAEDNFTQITDKEKIKEYINSLNSSVKGVIEEQIGDINNINSIEVSENGQIKINADNLQITTDSTGSYTIDNFSLPEFEDSDDSADIIAPETEETQAINDTQISEQSDTVEAEENQTVTDTTAEGTQSVDTQDSTPEEIQGAESAAQNIDAAETASSEVGSNVVSNIDTGIGEGTSLDGELNSLVQERQEVSEDLNNQQEDLTSTQQQKEDEIGSINQELEAGQADLDTANQAVDESEINVENAASDLEDAEVAFDESLDFLNGTEEDLDDANQEVDSAKQTESAAAADNQEKVAAQQDAQNESNAANNDLNTAAGNTGAAQSEADDKGKDLGVAKAGAVQAFSVLNQANSEVSQVQNQYNNAKAQASSGIKGIWEKLKSWVSSLATKLSNAIHKRDSAKAEADRKQAEQQRAQVASDKALDELDKRKQEQEEAQRVADAAQVVLDRATGAREVSDQEYADALIIVATAMDTRANAEDQYNSALQTYMETNNYKADAEGNLVDANGELVDAQKVAKDMETYIQGLSDTKQTKETSFNGIIENITGVIDKDENKIKQLDSEIKDVQEKIKAEKERIAMQEQMMAEMAKQKSELNAQKESDGIIDDIKNLFGGGTKKEEKELQSKQEKLEQALISGNDKDIAEAYKAIYGNKQVLVDDKGNIIDESSITDKTDTSKYTYCNISDLNDKSLKSVISNESKKAVESQEFIKEINNGAFTYDGQELSMDEIAKILAQQAGDQIQNAQNALDQQGIFSKALGFINNGLGIGTTGNNALAQANMLNNMVDALSNCKDPNEFASMYKAITGKDFNSEEICQLLAYDQVANNKTAKESSNDENDISTVVNTIADSAKSESVNKDDLSSLTKTKSSETVEDYKNTQKTIKDATTGIVTSAVCVAAVAAAPVTGGTSLALAVVVGTATNVGLNFVDSIYESDSDGKAEINYSGKEAFGDALSGALNGALSFAGSGAGKAVEKTINTAASGIKNQAVKSVAQAGGRILSGATTGGINGGIGAGGNYAIDSLIDENKDFSFKEFAQTTLKGAGFGFALGGAAASLKEINTAIRNLKVTEQNVGLTVQNATANEQGLVAVNSADDFADDAAKAAGSAKTAAGAADAADDFADDAAKATDSQHTNSTKTDSKTGNTASGAADDAANAADDAAKSAGSENTNNTKADSKTGNTTAGDDFAQQASELARKTRAKNLSDKIARGTITESDWQEAAELLGKDVDYLKSMKTNKSAYRQLMADVHPDMHINEDKEFFEFLSQIVGALAGK